ncbi:winged helix-turn-helix transcriptional regulator [bacterium]|nr:winged helix-turn-helix transcriptional regulator [bacterium]
MIRLYEQCNLSQRSIARALSISRPVVSEYVNKIQSSA